MLTKLNALGPLALLSITATASPVVLDKRLDNGVGKTPAMGWNSWNAFGCDGGSASHALTSAHAFIDLGLAKAGYEYVNIDDCWPEKTRDSAGNRKWIFNDLLPV